MTDKITEKKLCAVQYVAKKYPICIDVLKALLFCFFYSKSDQKTRVAKGFGIRWVNDDVSNFKESNASKDSKTKF